VRKSPLDRAKEARRETFKPVELTFEGLARLLVAGHLTDDKRKLNPTQWEFICSQDKFNAYMGAAGVAKTSTLVGGVILQMLLEPGTRALIGRKDYNDLKDTTARRFWEMVDRLPPGTLLDRDKNPPMKAWLRPALEGDPSEVTFMGLSDTIGSHEYHRIAVDEADEVDTARIDELMARLRAPGNPTLRMDLAFNPPDVNPHLYTRCTGLNAKGRKVGDPTFRLFRPTPGENDRNLPENYHADLAVRLSPDRAQRLVHGEWGAVFNGQPVYRDFSRPMHVRKGIPVDPQARMFRFWDFGYQHPFCIWAQLDEVGRLKCLHELSTENIEATAFGRLVITEGNQLYGPNQRYIDFGDIAVKQQKDTGSTLKALLDLGIRMQFGPMGIEASVDVVRRQLRTIIEGQPALQFDMAGCPVLISAVGGGYRMDKKGEAPLKDGYYDHSADALRYGVMNLMGPGRGWSDYDDRPKSVALWDTEGAVVHHRHGSTGFMPDEVGVDTSDDHEGTQF
jgi:hypothetical protein